MQGEIQTFQDEVKATAAFQKVSNSLLAMTACLVDSFCVRC
jgi:hypothetical protein